MRPPPWGQGAEAESGSFGSWLRRQREAREISLREVAERTKISLRYLQAMEDDRFDLLPAPIFAKGFLREYARYVGLSPDDVVNHYLSVQPKDEEPGQQTVHPERGTGRGWTYGLVLLASGLVVIGLVALALYWRDRHHPASAVEARPSIIAPVAPPAPAPLPAARPTAPLVVSLDFARDCWVESVVDGGSRQSELRLQGESVQLEARQSVVLTLGDAGGVEAQVNGYPLELGKKSSDVVRDLRIDLDTVRALKEKKERL